jgi:hypothetical protein
MLRKITLKRMRRKAERLRILMILMSHLKMILWKTKPKWKRAEKMK